MRVNEFIKRLKEIEKMPTLYKLGTFGNKYNGKYLLFDCSGLIKGTLWGYPNNGKYESNGVPDINANTLISKCTKRSTDMTMIIVGEMVHLEGHCGIYIGNGEVIESSPKWENGVQITKLSQRKWTSHGLLPYIMYDTDDVSEVVSNNKLENAIKVIADEVKKGTFGNGHENRMKAIYELVRKEVNK